MTTSNQAKDDYSYVQVKALIHAKSIKTTDN